VREYVADHSDEDEAEIEQLEYYFQLAYLRPSEGYDRQDGLWSHICAAVL